jgi:hypothetical protein
LLGDRRTWNSFKVALWFPIPGINQF